MNPIYRFFISANGGTERAVFPVYGDSLSKDFELETNEQFYRAKLSGKLTFVGADYDFIASKAFDAQFAIRIEISYNDGSTWAEYWKGQFWKTNCTFDDDNKNVSMTPEAVDNYTDVLAGLDKEFNLIDLAPVIVPVNVDKRPMIQVYVPGQNVIACFLSGMWWEQECNVVTNNDTVVIEGQTYPALTHKYHFSLNRTQTYMEISGTMQPELPASVMADGGKYFNFVVGNYRYKRDYGEAQWDYIAIYDVNTGNALWVNNRVTRTLEDDFTVNLSPVSESGATGTVTLHIQNYYVYARYICDVESSGGTSTYPIPDDDLVPNNRNYSRVLGYYAPSTIFFVNSFTNNPTKWGLYQPNKYYINPDQIAGSGVFEAFPISRARWGAMSIWFAFNFMSWSNEEQWRKQTTIKDAYPIASVIKVLLRQIAPALSHAETTDYSQFLYGQNPITSINQRIIITPKSNVLNAGYDQPAQKAPITLKRVLDMLRDCYRCYWFVDSNKRFRIEHISYFRNGGAYPGTPDYPVIGRDLTQEIVTRNGKHWSFCTSKYEFDKPEMVGRYEFGWMDDVTELFEGFPIDIVSQYVNPENIEQISITQFTSDIDYVLLNPTDVSKDGFMLLAAVLSSGGNYYLPYVNFTYHNASHVLQNAYAAFVYLQQFYAYDMPAKYYMINGVQHTALGVKKLKKQTLKFPVLTDPDTMQLIKTNIGNGTIQKMSVNLSSRNANTTLIYDTE